MEGTRLRRLSDTLPARPKFRECYTHHQLSTSPAVFLSAHAHPAVKDSDRTDQQSPLCPLVSLLCTHS